MTPQEAATALLEKLDLKDSFPLPLQTVVQSLGYRAQLFPKSEKTRNLACGVNAAEKTLFANASDQSQEQRYSFAHAIGHVVLHEGKNFVIKKTHLHPSNEDPEEWEANQFADELLMNQDIFLQKWDEFGGASISVAGCFGLSKERITARAQALNIL